MAYGLPWRSECIFSSEEHYCKTRAFVVHAEGYIYIFVDVTANLCEKHIVRVAVFTNTRSYFRWTFFFLISLVLILTQMEYFVSEENFPMCDSATICKLIISDVTFYKWQTESREIGTITDHRIESRQLSITANRGIDGEVFQFGDIEYY